MYQSLFIIPVFDISKGVLELCGLVSYNLNSIYYAYNTEVCLLNLVGESNGWYYSIGLNLFE